MKTRMPALAAGLAVATALAVAAPEDPPTREQLEQRVTYLEKRLSIAEREAKLTQRRLDELKEELEALGPYLDEARYRRLVDEIARQTAETRGLELKEPIKAVILDPKGLSDLLAKLFEEEAETQNLRGEELTWSLLGLIPPGASLEALYMNLLEEQVGGLYNDRTKSLYVVDTFDPKSLIGRIILSHEICHALQDQNFSISDLAFRTDNPDQNLATAAVLEGDATLVMVQWAAANASAGDLLTLTGAFSQQMEQMDMLETAPPALVQALLFPYMAGAEFWAEMIARGGELGRNGPYTRPPQSTEQILHFDKYWPNQEAPIDVTLPEWDGKDGLEEVMRGSVGEWSARLVLTPEDRFPQITAFSMDVLARDPEATRAAAGWGGDSLFVAADEAGDRRFLVWKSAWDTETDAQEFEAAMAARTASRDLPPGSWSVQRRGAEALVVIASDAALHDTARRWAAEDRE